MALNAGDDRAMALEEPLAVGVTDLSGVADARRRATALAASLGFDETDVGRVAIAVTEAATNLVEHATGGEILGRAVETEQRAAIEILALDRGPGIESVDAALRDGFSSAGSAGTGLGAIRRAATEFDIFSTRPGGTVIVAVLSGGARMNDAGRPGLRVAGVSVPKRGESLCGDAWTGRPLPDGLAILVVDGLGHGPRAADAAREARHIFEKSPDDVPPAATLDRLHRGLRATRGAAAAVARIVPDRGVLTYAGVGNIAGFILGGERPRALLSHSGILGHEVRRVQEFTYPWAPGSTLVLHSDGLTSHWGLHAYPGAIRRHPAVIAGLLYRDFSRPHDDLTVVVASPRPA
jgi:anti-sigma regulatory factor (Ser/Thr protein kinase)